ncbi:relaxase/mobilization nuclease domain-containing protein [Pedobacter mucosus]|uniref:relaxase/mobilization nuclease domain-containing protein n=1 Tax=Pedobacter mucosus TaxID=2895286 RepID=UPI001EE45615|nr:relaxase/mobilization nuclease domain-containing protein [Pedobacter mucosus]UKT63053.1 relaxase/mobilization nuclease domain-containing protein [Pedobacter mucosus]
MIGKISTGKSFSGCLSYLHDGRLQENQELQLEEMAKKQAEVLHYNNCFGTKKQVIRQLVEVSRLNPNLARPVFHASLSFALADGGLLDEQQKADIGISLARSFGFDRNQFVVISHGDTEHEHIHIVGNRVGYDGKTAGDGNSYKRIAEFCREMEREYSLTQVLSPNRFLKPEQRIQITSRSDSRKERLKGVLEWAIGKSTNMDQVKARMEKQGYGVELARGIAFTDGQLVRTKGSEVGYSLARIIEKLERKRLLREKEKLASVKQEQLKENKSRGLSI